MFSLYKNWKEMGKYLEIGANKSYLSNPKTVNFGWRWRRMKKVRYLFNKRSSPSKVSLDCCILIFVI